MATQTVAAGPPSATHYQGNPDPGASHFRAPGHSWATGGQNQGGKVYPEALEWVFERSTEDQKEEGKKKQFLVASIADWTLSFTTLNRLYP